MDDSVLAQFQSTFLLSGQVNDPHTVHPHYTLYKAKKEGYGSQEARRRRFLEEQKSRRRDFADHARRIAEGEELADDNDGEMDEGGDMDEVDDDSKLVGSALVLRKRPKDRYPYRNQLMLSEWLVDKPEDFESNWLAVVVPIGRRCLVVAAQKTTYAYSRAGAQLKNFPSLLPGGCRHTHRLAQDFCILDCVFHEGKQTFYILDVMCWAGYPVYDSDTEFRVFWKEQKYKECEKISTYSRVNPLPFIDLPFHACTKESLEHVLAEAPPFQVDGLLFIHKECRYIIGMSPLAAWLKPQMVPDILGIGVSAEFLAQSPAMPLGSSRKSKEGKMDTNEGGSGRGGSTKGRRKEGKMDTTEGEDGTRTGENGTRTGKEGGSSDSELEPKVDSKPSMET